MAQTEPTVAAAPEIAEAATQLALPVWKKALLSLSGMFVAAGGTLTAIESQAPAEEPVAIEEEYDGGMDMQTTGGAIVLDEEGHEVEGYDELDPYGDVHGGPTAYAYAEEEPAPELPWNMFFLKGGLSLFLGFCIGAVVRAFFKVSVLVIGVGTLGLLGLSYMGVLQVDWTTLEGHWNSLAGRLDGDLASFQGFLASNLPSGGMASLGLFAGVKKG